VLTIMADGTNRQAGGHRGSPGPRSGVALRALEKANMTCSAIFTPRSLASRPRPACLAQDPTNGGQDFRRELATSPLSVQREHMSSGRSSAFASATSLRPGPARPRYAQALLGAVSRMIVARGETPFLHVFSDNSPAIALYHRMGQGIRRLYVTVLGNHS